MMWRPLGIFVRHLSVNLKQNVLKGPVSSLPQDSYGYLMYRSLRDAGKSKVAMIDGESGVMTTYDEILKRTVRLAQSLTNLGLSKNDTITICGANSLYFTIPAVAALYLGITVAPLNNLYTQRELIHAMNISQPKVVFCSSNTLDNIVKASEEVKSVENIIVLDGSADLPDSVHSLQEYLIGTDTGTKFEVTPVDVDHVAAILCSSGTTGVAKGVVQTHRNFHASYNFSIDPRFGGFHSSRIGMALLPFYHSYGFLSHLHMLAAQMQMVVLPRFEEKMFLNAIQQYGITNVCAVPPLVLFLGKSPLVDQYDLSSLQDIMCAAAPLSQELQALVKQRLGFNHVRQAYGLTESAYTITVTPPNSHKYGSIGVVGPNMEIKIRDVTTNQTLGPNEEGEICFRGDMTMKGYVGNPAATAEIMDSEGWMLSGDAGYYDTDGHLYVVDRYKELIKYKGYQVPPAEIEAILHKLPQIKDCGVIGKPDSAAGQLPVAFVVRQPNASITKEDIINFVDENICYHKRLHGGIRFVNEIPRNPTGKILRRILQSLLDKDIPL